MKKYLVLICSILVLFFIGCEKEHEHKFSEATCSAPKTCVECGETQGDVISHTTEFGVCDYCNQLIGEELGKKIIQLINDGNKKVQQGIDYSDNRINSCNDYDDFYSLETVTGGYYLDAKNKYKEAYELCGSIEELSGLKDSLKNCIDNCPSKPSSANQNELENFFNDETEFLVKVVCINGSGRILADVVNENYVGIEP